MRGGLIIWDSRKLVRLADAIRAYESGETPLVHYADGPERQFGAAKVTHEWTRDEADAIYEQALAAIRAAPVRSYPENREGPEP